MGPLPERPDLERILPKNCFKGALKAGRHAQMIPTLASTVVQIVDSRVPEVGSLLFEDMSNVVKRTIEVATMLPTR